MSGFIDRKKIEQDVVEAVSAAAQRFLEASSDAQRQKAAGSINGLADMLDDLHSGLSDGELYASFQGDLVQAQASADEADTAASVRYHTAAANEISSMMKVVDAWNAVQAAKADYDAVMNRGGSGTPPDKAVGDVQKLAEEFDKAFADSGVPTVPLHEDDGDDDDAPALPPTPTGRKRPANVQTERVSIDDVIVWSYCRDKEGEIPIDDLVLEFYLKGKRSDSLAHNAALNAIYKMADRNCATARKELGGKSGKRLVVTGYSLTEHGRFEAQRLMGPQFQCDSNDQPTEDDLVREYGHLKEDSDAQV